MVTKEPWYSVKSLFRDENANVYEERVVLFRADSFEEAENKGVKEAEEYVINLDNTEFVKVIDVFHMFDEILGEGIEVYSLMTDSDLSADEYIKRRYF
jgi:hypothetical protein